MNRRQKGLPPPIWDEIMDSSYRVQLEIVSMDDYSMEGESKEEKLRILNTLLNHFVKLEEYETCGELKKQIDKLSLQ
jgi:hypothetical protein